MFAKFLTVLLMCAYVCLTRKHVEGWGPGPFPSFLHYLLCVVCWLLVVVAGSDDCCCYRSCLRFYVNIALAHVLLVLVLVVDLFSPT